MATTADTKLKDLLAARDSAQQAYAPAAEATHKARREAARRWREVTDAHRALHEHVAETYGESLEGETRIAQYDGRVVVGGRLLTASDEYPPQDGEGD